MTAFRSHLETSWKFFLYRQSSSQSVSQTISRFLADMLFSVVLEMLFLVQVGGSLFMQWKVISEDIFVPPPPRPCWWVSFQALEPSWASSTWLYSMHCIPLSTSGSTRVSDMFETQASYDKHSLHKPDFLGLQLIKLHHIAALVKSWWQEWLTKKLIYHDVGNLAVQNFLEFGEQILKSFTYQCVLRSDSKLWSSWTVWMPK